MIHIFIVLIVPIFMDFKVPMFNVPMFKVPMFKVPDFYFFKVPIVKYRNVGTSKQISL